MLRSAAAPFFPAATIDYAGYVLWRGFLDEAQLDGETAPLESGISCIGYPHGHGIFYFVASGAGSITTGERLVNWGMYLTVPNLGEFMTGQDGRMHEGSLPPGAMPVATEQALKAKARMQFPDYYADIVERSANTFAYAIYDCIAPAYRAGRICLAGDAGAFARPHTAAGALKSIKDAVTLVEGLATQDSLDTALNAWSAARSAENNALVAYGQQLGRALVTDIPDWSQMDAAAMEYWFATAVTTPTEFLPRGSAKSTPA